MNDAALPELHRSDDLVVAEVDCFCQHLPILKLVIHLTNTFKLEFMAFTQKASNLMFVEDEVPLGRLGDGYQYNTYNKYGKLIQRMPMLRRLPPVVLQGRLFVLPNNAVLRQQMHGLLQGPIMQGFLRTTADRANPAARRSHVAGSSGRPRPRSIPG